MALVVLLVVCVLVFLLLLPLVSDGSDVVTASSGLSDHSAFCSVFATSGPSSSEKRWQFASGGRDRSQGQPNAEAFPTGKVFPKEKESKKKSKKQAARVQKAKDAKAV